MWFKNASDKLSLTAVLKRFELNAPSFFLAVMPTFAL